MEGLQGQRTERDVIRIEVVAAQPLSFESAAPPVAPEVHGGELVTWSSSGQSLVVVLAPESIATGGLSIDFQVQRAGSGNVSVLLTLQGLGADIIVSEVCVG